MGINENQVSDSNDERSGAEGNDYDGNQLDEDQELLHLMGINENQVSDSNDERSGAEGNDYDGNQLDENQVSESNDGRNGAEGNDYEGNQLDENQVSDSNDERSGAEANDYVGNQLDENQVSDSNDERSGAEANDYVGNQLDENQVSKLEEHHMVESVLDTLWKEQKNDTSANHSTPITVLEDSSTNITSANATSDAIISNNNSTKPLNQSDALDDSEGKNGGEIVESLEGQQNSQPSFHISTPVVPLTDGVTSDNSTIITSANNTSDTITKNETLTKSSNTSDTADDSNGEIAEGSNAEPLSSVDAQSNTTNAAAESLTSSTPDKNQTSSSEHGHLVTTTNNNTSVEKSTEKNATIQDIETPNDSSFALNVAGVDSDADGNVSVNGTSKESLSTNATKTKVTTTKNNTSVEKSTEKNATIQDIETPKDSSSALNVAGVDSDADGNVSVNGTSKESLSTNATKTNVMAKTAATGDTPSEETKSVEHVDEIPAMVMNNTEKTHDATTQLNSTTIQLDVPLIVVPDNNSLSNTTGNSTDPKSPKNSTKTLTSAK
jgi:hypothetical protein